MKVLIPALDKEIVLRYTPQQLTEDTPLEIHLQFWVENWQAYFGDLLVKGFWSKRWPNPDASYINAKVLRERLSLSSDEMEDNGYVHNVSLRRGLLDLYTKWMRPPEDM